MARRVLSVTGCPPDTELSILIVNDKAIRGFNRVYRGIDRPTDVLAFSAMEGPFLPRKRPEVVRGLQSGPYIIGDIVISAERARRQAAEAGHTVKRELWLLLIHGILHLLGYDHEASKKEARRMRRREREVWKEIFNE